MLYTLKIYALITIAVFGLAGMFLLSLAALKAAKDYAAATQVMRRIASGGYREPFANSRTISRSHETDSSRVA